MTKTPQVKPEWSTGIYIGGGVVATPKEDYPDDWYNEDDNGESDSDRYMDELDQEPWESKTDYCDRMGFDM